MRTSGVDDCGQATDCEGFVSFLLSSTFLSFSLWMARFYWQGRCGSSFHVASDSTLTHHSSQAHSFIFPFSISFLDIFLVVPFFPFLSCWDLCAAFFFFLFFTQFRIPIFLIPFFSL